MAATGCTILWPSRLKIGARSKKDPNVKMIGFPKAVEKAKAMMLKDLDTKVCASVCVRSCLHVCMHACMRVWCMCVLVLNALAHKLSRVHQLMLMVVVCTSYCVCCDYYLLLLVPGMHIRTMVCDIRTYVRTWLW